MAYRKAGVDTSWESVSIEELEVEDEEEEESPVPITTRTIMRSILAGDILTYSQTLTELSKQSAIPPQHLHTRVLR